MTPAADAPLTLVQWLAATALVFCALLLPLALLAAWWLRGRYARTVLQLQARLAPPPVDRALEPVLDIDLGQLAGAGAAGPNAPLRIERLWAGRSPAVPAALPARRLRRWVLGVQFVGGVLFWWLLLLVLATGMSMVVASQAADDAPVGLAGTLLGVALLSLPPALAWALQAGLRERSIWLVLIAGGVLLGVWASLTVKTTLAETAGFIGAMLLLPLLASLFLRPALRGAGPPLVAAALVGWAAFILVCVGLALVFPDDGTDTPWTQQDSALLAGLVLVAVVVMAWVGRRTLGRIALGYAGKHFSEQQLALAAYWALVSGLVLSLVLMVAFDDSGENKDLRLALLLLLAMAAFWLWRVLQRCVLRAVVRRAPATLPPLLLLRVFKPSGRSEAFMDRLLARWRFAAPVWLIAGPDLAGAFMEPDEFFAWTQGALGERFVADAAQIPDRVARLDHGRDPDGRFRISEMFCANHVWQQAVQALIAQAGVVLLDLREYTEQRAGTRFELELLLARGGFERLILLTDEAGDAPQLRAALQRAWAAGGGGGVAKQLAPVRLLQLSAGSDAELEGVFRAVAGAAASAAAVAAGA